MKHKCKNCDHLTENPIFCSRNCAAKFNNKHYPKRKLTKKCILCSSVVANWRTRFCEKHMSTTQNKILITKAITLQEHLDNLSPYRRNSPLKFGQIRDYARSWYKHLAKKPCANCGYSLHVQIAHIKSVTSFSLSATIGEVNAESNIIQLCPNCHWELDHGFLDLSAHKDSNLDVTS